MNKDQILDEIRRTAQANSGKPLGSAAFAKETGIKMSDWYTKPWIRWGDALKEAGFAPNQLNIAFDDEHLVRKLIELQPPRFPVAGDLRVKARSTRSFPSHTVFDRLGNKSERVAKVAAYCIATGGLDDIITLCQTVQPTSEPLLAVATNEVAVGYVYLLLSARKIG